VITLIWVHVGFYVLVAGLLAWKLHVRSKQLFEDDRQQMAYWESRLPVLLFWALLWEVTLPFTPWFFEGLLDHDRANERAFAFGALIFVGSVITTSVLVDTYAPRDASGVFIQGPPVPTPRDLYCRHMKALDRAQPPHQQFYGTGCP